MKLIVGLGNPGKEYINTRHNAGFLFVDRLREKFLYHHDIFSTEWRDELSMFSEIAFVKRGSKIIAVIQKPQTYMNNSGDAVAKVAKKFDVKTEDIILVHDDLDIKLGNFKIQTGKSPIGHNGVDNVEERLHTKEFRRIRIGIENREGQNIPGLDYVLMKFDKDEKVILNEAIDEAIAGILSDIIL